MYCRHFHTLTAVIEAKASFKHFKLALRRTSSEQTLSDNFDFAMVRAVALIALLISSVKLMQVRSSLFSLKGIVAWQEAKILPISRPLESVDSKCGSIVN